MLLLVLILVLIAFGLLLVGFLSASVLWAWVSVAVSLAAAGVLTFDWLQRRSVVRAGDEAGGEYLADPVVAERAPSVPASARPAFGVGDGGRADLDPATEVLPVIRPSAPHGAGVDPRFDPHADAQQTVMMSAVQPPGSPAGPSGATPGQTPSSESSSPSVTISKNEPRVPDSGDQSTVVVRAAGRDAPEEPPVDLAATTATPAATTAATPVPSDVPHGPPSDPDPGAGAVGTAATGSSAASPPSGSAAEDPDGPTDVGDVEATTAVPPREERAGAREAGPPETPGSLFASGPATNGTSQPDRPAGAAPPPAAADPVVEEPAHVVSTHVREPDVPVEPAQLHGEAPEEQPDPEAAALVAELEDEVLVVDEQPRYHVTGCRSLAAAALIPLPVREAVELGFTPCGWCSPDHTLASRHRATAR